MCDQNITAPAGPCTDNYSFPFACSIVLVVSQPITTIFPETMADVLARGHFAILSQLLRVRLANKAILDVNIVENDLLLRRMRLDNYHGRFLGSFIRRPKGSICFLLLMRTDENGLFDKALTWYVNKDIYKMPESEKAWFWARVEGYPQLGVVIVKTNLMDACHPSALLHAIEITIGLHLATNFKRRRVIHLENVVTFESTNTIAKLPSCNIAYPREDADAYWNQLKDEGLVCLDYNCHGEQLIGGHFDILRIRFKGHWFYGIPFKHVRLFMVLVCHDALMRPQDVMQFKCSLARGFGPSKPQYLYASRFRSHDNRPCGDKLILQACAKLRSLPLLVIHVEDVKSLVLGEDLALIPEFGYVEPEPAPVSSPELEVADAVEVLEMSEQEQFADESQESFIQVTNDGYVSSSQSTIADTPNFIEDLRQQVSSLEESDIVLNLSPRDDPYGQLLSDREFFLGYLKEFIPRVARRFCISIDITEPVDFPGLQDIPPSTFGEGRFLFIPLFSFDVSMLVIIDKEVKLIGCMNPSKVAAVETLGYVKAGLTHFTEYSISELKLTLSFHHKFQLAHLMAGLIHLEKAWDYALIIPKRLVYQEVVFRNMCTVICKRQELANHEKNLENGLIDVDGSLLEGAFRTFSSPVQIVHCPVKTDQCLFCDSRSARNLGSHMKMAHGGLAVDLRSRQIE